MGLELLQGEFRAEMDTVEREIGDELEKTARSKALGYWLDLSGDVLENTNVAVSILNDLLNYDKIETGTFKLEFGTVDIWRLFRKTVSEFKLQAKNRKVDLEVKIDARLPSERSDDASADVEQVLVEALSIWGDDIRLAQVSCCWRLREARRRG